MRSSTSWWASKVRRFRAHLRATVAPAERSELATWVSPSQLALFESMHAADRRHGLDVVVSLRAARVTSPDALVAGLLHDAGKGRTGVWPRVAYALGDRYGHWIWRLAAVVPGFRSALERLRTHAEISAGLAATAGCSPRTVDLIRHQESPTDPEFGELLRLADEAN
jgi:hypothetical protein